MSGTDLVLSLVATIRHDGKGGVADDLESVAGLRDWFDQVNLTQPSGTQPSGTQPSGTQPSGTQPSGTQPSGTQPSGTQPSGTQPSGTQPSGTQPSGTGLGEADRQRVVGLRAAIRSLFARAVRPGPPSRADAARLLDLDTALDRVNRAAAALGPPRLSWVEPSGPTAGRHVKAGDPVTVALAMVADAAIAFLTSEDRHRLRACPAPRCVRYFLRDDPRQQWCKPSCGNRARVARHHRRVTGQDS